MREPANASPTRQRENVEPRSGRARQQRASGRAGCGRGRDRAFPWKEFPYYAQRYGERGWRFSLSDSRWHAGGVLESVKNWAADGSRFSREWVNAVQATIEQARAGV